MRNFNEWYKNIEREYPLYQDKDGYNIGNIRALKVGWKAALKQVLQIKITSDSCVYLDMLRDNIRKALKEE